MLFGRCDEQRDGKVRLGESETDSDLEGRADEQPPFQDLHTLAVLVWVLICGAVVGGYLYGRSLEDKQAAYK